MRRAAVGLGTAFAVGAWLACTSSSPFTRPPASIAVDEPCRFMGTFHKESRVRIEELRMCRVITDAQWGCLATELKALDVAFTAECRERTVRYAEIASDQHDRYVRCLPEGPKAVARCAVLSDDATCIAEHCS